jgi:hypothetical protein
MLRNVRSGYSKLSHVRSGLVRLCHVKSVYVILGKDSSGLFRLRQVRSE